MDVTTVAQNVAVFLAPFLPYLVKAVEKGVDQVVQRLGAEAWEQAKALWEKLKGSLAVEKAAEDVAEMPGDPDAQAALRLQLKKLLMEDTTLAEEIDRLMGGEVIQRVLAERGSQVRGVRQAAAGGAKIRQEVIARDRGTIEDVTQKQG